MGRLEEAETALSQALSMEPENSTALANKVVLETILGRDAGEARRKLEGVDRGHEMVGELEARREGFRGALGKYAPKFEP